MAVEARPAPAAALGSDALPVRCGGWLLWTLDPATWPTPTPAVAEKLARLRDLKRTSPLRWRGTCPVCRTALSLVLFWNPPCPMAGEVNGRLGFWCERGCLVTAGDMGEADHHAN